MAASSWPRKNAASSGGFAVPGVEPDAELAPAVEEAAGDEVAGVGDEIDHVAVGGLALDGADGAGVDPGMPAIKRAGPARLQDHAARSYQLPPRSTASM